MCACNYKDTSASLWFTPCHATATY